MARALSGTALAWDELETALAGVDIVITSTGAAEPVITRAAVQRVTNGRRARPLFFIDIAVPRDVEAGVDSLGGVYRYDIDDLKQVVDANIRERLPTIVSLRERLEEIRLGELRKALARLVDAPPETRQALEALSSAIVNKILHAPITKLRESSRAGAHRTWLELVHELFGLTRK